MRVLYLCHRIPYPPDKGEKIRAFHQLRAMGERHEVDLFTLADRKTDLVHRTALEPYCRQVTVERISPRWARLRSLPYLLTRMPLTVPCFYSPELDQKVRRALLERSYDRIFVYSSAMSQYVERAAEIPTVVDFVDVDSDKWRQYAGFQRFPFSSLYRREWHRLQEYERKVSEECSCILVSTEREAELIRRISSAANVHVIQNGVDTQYFDPHLVPPDRAFPAIVFTGDMSYFPNREAVTFFARKVLPLVRRTVSDVRFYIVGRNPGREVQQLGELTGVEVTGQVPDVRAWLAKAHIAVAPFTIAAGIQNKVLEALAYGLPVVATPLTTQGLSKSIAEIIGTAESPEGLAAEIIAVLRNEELARQRGLEGRRRVTSEYSWRRSLNQLLEFVENPPRREQNQAKEWKQKSCPAT
jgi:sugar transferase (PEP-CTERM/EpsH1 system associated)